MRTALAILLVLLASCPHPRPKSDWDLVRAGPPVRVGVDAQFEVGDQLRIRYTLHNHSAGGVYVFGQPQPRDAAPGTPYVAFLNERRAVVQLVPDMKRIVMIHTESAIHLDPGQALRGEMIVDLALVYTTPWVLPGLEFQTDPRKGHLADVAVRLEVACIPDEMARRVSTDRSRSPPIHTIESGLADPRYTSSLAHAVVPAIVPDPEWYGVATPRHSDTIR